MSINDSFKHLEKQLQDITKALEPKMSGSIIEPMSKQVFATRESAALSKPFNSEAPNSYKDDEMQSFVSDDKKLEDHINVLISTKISEEISKIFNRL